MHNEQKYNMRRTLDWFTWITAVILGLLTIMAQFAYARTGKDPAPFTVDLIAVFVLVGVISQLALFVTPWAVAWNSSRQKIVFLLMLPSIFWLLTQIYSDVNEVIEHFGEGGEMYVHALEAISLLLFLAVYLIQAFRVSIDFLREKRTDGDA